jgi:cell division protein FtsL
MARLNLLLLIVALGCALGSVASQHHARKLFVALEKERERTKHLEIEYSQLQLEASTWSTQARIERIATSQLGLRALTPERMQLLVSNDHLAVAK